MLMYPSIHIQGLIPLVDPQEQFTSLHSWCNVLRSMLCVLRKLHYSL